MKNVRRIILITILMLVAAFATSLFSYADTIPNVSKDEKCEIVLNENKLEDFAIINNGNIYVSIDFLNTYGSINEAWAFNTNDGKLYLDVSKLDVYFGDDETTYFIKNNSGIVGFSIKYYTSFEKQRWYISLGSVASLARLQYEYKENVVYINQYSFYTEPFGLAKGNEIILSSLLEEEQIITTLKENKIVKILEETTTYYKIENEAKEVFYINKDDLEILDNISYVHSYSRVHHKKDVYEEAINATWMEAFKSPEKIDGLDVISDISFWPVVYGEEKTFDPANCSINYGIINAAHDNGYKWWLCAQNFNTTNSEIQKNIPNTLKDRALSHKAIAKYLFYTCIFNADGINLDYEEMTDNSLRNYFIYFVQTLCHHADKLGLTTSVCTFAGTSWNNNYGLYPYDIFGQCCDFICEMTYDERLPKMTQMSKAFWTSSTDYIGSKAPKAKILMGTTLGINLTLWIDDEYISGAYKYLDFAYNPANHLDNPTITWDEDVGQYLFSCPYTLNDTSYLAKFYIEEERSAALKAQYIIDNGYGGTISWKFDYASLVYENNQGIYKAYNEIYHKNGKYEDFIPKE